MYKHYLLHSFVDMFAILCLDLTVFKSVVLKKLAFNKSHPFPIFCLSVLK